MKTVLLVIAGAFVLFVFYMFIKMRMMKNSPSEADNEKIKILDDKNFAAQIKSGVTLVDFWAAWCMPCKMMVPILNELADSLPENTTIAKLNVDESQQIAAKYGVRSIPTSIVFKNGKEIKRFVGVKPASFFLKELEKLG